MAFLKMQATDFELRHQALVHQLIVGAAFLTYLFDRDDVVWRFVKDSSAPHSLERTVFIIATLLIALGVGICTRARANNQPGSHGRYLGEVCYAIGLASLVPVGGFVILVGGESLRVFRLVRRDVQDPQPLPLRVSPSPAVPAGGTSNRGWGASFRLEAVKWGILITMIVFVITLKDRYAEVLAAASFLAGTLLNLPVLNHSKGDSSPP